MALKSCHIYETAFDSKVEKKNIEGVDLIGKIANHPLLQILHLKRKPRSQNICSSDLKRRVKGSQSTRSKFYVSISPPLVNKLPDRGSSHKYGRYASCRDWNTSYHIAHKRLRPIGLSKSDDEILSRWSDSPEDDESLDGYGEGIHAQELASDLHSLHITSQRPFTKELLIAPPEQFRDISTNSPREECKYSKLDSSSGHLSCEESASSSVRPSITRPRCLISSTTGGSNIQNKVPEFIGNSCDVNKGEGLCGDIKTVIRYKDGRASLSHDLPRRKDLQKLNIQSPPGSDPLPLKFSKKTPVKDTGPSSWFTPLVSKDAKEMANKKTHMILSNAAKNNNSTDSSSSLSDSLAVLLDTGSQRHLDEEVICPPCTKYSSIDSVATSSALSSLESVRSSMSDGNKSTASNESAFSSCKGSISSGSPRVNKPFLNLNQPHRSLIHSAKFQILSPISDKSQEPSLDFFSAGVSPKTPHDCNADVIKSDSHPKKMQSQITKNILEDFRNVHHIIPDPIKKTEDQKTESDSGISTDFRNNSNNKSISNICDNKLSQTLQGSLCDLPFDMPKLRRKLAMVNASNNNNMSSSSSSLSSGFPCPDPNARLSLPMNALVPSNSGSPIHPVISKLQTSSGVSQCSSSNSSDWDIRSSGESSSDQGTPKLLNSRSHNRCSLALELGCTAMSAKGKDVDVNIPVANQTWYHGAICRKTAEDLLRNQPEGSYLVRSLDSSKSNYSLSLKSARGFMHLRLRHDPEKDKYQVGRFDELLFPSVPHAISHFSIYRIPIKGAEHMVLLYPLPSETL